MVCIAEGYQNPDTLARGLCGGQTQQEKGSSSLLQKRTKKPLLFAPGRRTKWANCGTASFALAYLFR
jgi:hypothetical protein